MEQLGTKRKFWYRDDRGSLLLFKHAREATGEDWAEKIAAELCAVLGLPHASYELAEWQGHRGVITPTFNPAEGRLVFGNELLEYAFAGYDTAPRHRRQHHTVGRVFALLGSQSIRSPYGWECPRQLTSAAAVFTGYLMLDVLIGNQDRHDENWGILTLDRSAYLQPTFDHASSLGRNETTVARKDRLETRDTNRSMERYIARATSALYGPGLVTRPLSTIDAFLAAGKHDPVASTYWLDQLRLVTNQDLMSIVSRVSLERMDETAKIFALRMLELNKQRLLDQRR